MTSGTRGIGKSVHSSEQAAFCELMVGARKAGETAKGLDRIDNPLVVGGHDHDIDLRETGTAVDVLDHGPAVNGSERLTGKAG